MSDTIREATSEDLDIILELYRELTPDDLPIEPNTAQAILDRIVGDRALSILLLEVDHEPVATCAVSIIPNLTRGGMPYAVIENVVTRKANRGKGCGSAVMKAAIAKAESENCYKIMLMTGSSNPKTHRFYESLGFNGSDKTAYVLKKDVPTPAH